MQRSLSVRLDVRADAVPGLGAISESTEGGVRQPEAPARWH